MGYSTLNTCSAYVAYFCYVYLLGEHTEFRNRPIPTEEQCKSLSLLHAVDWATLKDLPVLFITAAKDFHSAHEHNEKLDLDKEDTEKIAVINTWYQKTFGGGVAPPSKMLELAPCAARAPTSSNLQRQARK